MSVKAAIHAYTREKLNCAQSILKAFRRRKEITQNEIDAARALGGGKADGGVCGALHAALLLHDGEEEKRCMRENFSARAGSEHCREIRAKKMLTCVQCVELAAELIETGCTRIHDGDSENLIIAGRRANMSLIVQKRLLDHLKPLAGGAVIADVRIGLGYTAVRLESGHAGVAWTPKSDAPCCTHFQAAGTLTGRPAEELLEYLADEKSGLARAAGLATANALLSALPHPPTSREEIVSTLHVTPQDKVAMVGYFGPIVAELRKIGCGLDIIELNPHHGAGETLTPEQGVASLANCTVAVLTGTSLINGTCDELLAGLGNPRAAVLLGPSTPLCAEAFSGTKITHLAGSRVREADAVLRVVSEGGGTMLMKKYVDFEHLVL